MRTILSIIVVIALILIGVSLLGSPTEAPTEPTEPGEGNGDVGEETETVSVYFYDEEADTNEAGDIMCSPDSVLAVEREVDAEEYEEEPVRTVLGELLEGPTEEEVEEGFSSEFPAEDFTIESVELEDGTATVTFADPNNFTSGGSCRAGLLYSQVVKTIEDVEEVDEAVILPETLFQP